MQVEIDPQKEVETLAMGYLRNNDANPEVGMGLGYTTAVQYAIEYVNKHYNIVADIDIDLAFDRVLHARSRRSYCGCTKCNYKGWFSYVGELKS